MHFCHAWLNKMEKMLRDKVAAGEQVCEISEYAVISVVTSIHSLAHDDK